MVFFISSVAGGFGADKCALESVGVPPYFATISCNLLCGSLVSSRCCCSLAFASCIGVSSILDCILSIAAFSTDRISLKYSASLELIADG
jgi:hypothetical protein